MDANAPHPDAVAYAGTMLRHRKQAVTVEYTDASGTRVVKGFPSAPAAKRFYVQKSSEGADPKIVSVKQ